MEYETPVVNINVPVATETNDNMKVNETQQVEPIHLLNEPPYEKQPDNMENNIMIVDDNVSLNAGAEYI